MRFPDHPIIDSCERTGYPRGYEDEEDQELDPDMAYQEMRDYAFETYDDD